LKLFLYSENILFFRWYVIEDEMSGTRSTYKEEEEEEEEEGIRVNVRKCEIKSQIVKTRYK
jgi:hypothetical protein